MIIAAQIMYPAKISMKYTFNKKSQTQSLGRYPELDIFNKLRLYFPRGKCLTDWPT